MRFQNTPEEMALREENRKKVAEFFAHGAHAPEYLYHKNFVMLQPFFFPDSQPEMEMPEMPPEMPPEGDMPEWTIDWVWNPTTIWGTDDPNYFFAENSGQGKQMRGDGKYYDYKNHYFHTFRFQDGKIIEYREIGNPLGLMDAMGVSYDPLPTPDDTMQELKDNGVI